MPKARNNFDKATNLHCLIAIKDARSFIALQQRKRQEASLFYSNERGKKLHCFTAMKEARGKTRYSHGEVIVIDCGNYSGRGQNRGRGQRTDFEAHEEDRGQKMKP